MFSFLFYYKYFFESEKAFFEFAIVKRGDVLQQVLATGRVKKRGRMDLSFERSGTIEKIYVEVRDRIEEGQVLAKLETTGLSIQLKEAKAGLEVAQANLERPLLLLNTFWEHDGDFCCQ